MARSPPRPPARPIQRLLVCNRGEIATRIISAANELDIPTFTVYTSHDTSHVRQSTHAIELPSPAAYLDIPYLISLIKAHGIDAVHPGYGFLSESAEFARRAWEEAGAVVIGPGWEILEQTGDKLKARKLAEECSVPVTAALLTPTNDINTIRSFADRIGYPIMIKAVDGGGGRGIRLVRHADELASLAQRAIEESPSRQVFAEKAAVDGFRHVEVQIVGDGTGPGGVRHLWERECSIQRRYQKVVEMAPSTIRDRDVVGEVIAAAVRMAEKLHYFSLGTFEFLLHPTTCAYYFLEINPRLQVEHTITEALTSTDLVQTQLLLAQGAALTVPPHPPSAAPPPLHALQLRLTAENPARAWTVSPGAVTSLRLPHANGPGIRVDTHAPASVSTDFDALLAKLVVTGATWRACVGRAARALADARVEGVSTNAGVLRAIVAHADFLAGACDTGWLERSIGDLVRAGERIGSELSSREGFAVAGRRGGDADSAAATSSIAASSSSCSSSAPLFRPGDAWSITLQPLPEKSATSALPSQQQQQQQQPPPTHHIALTRLLRNAFPASLSAEIAFSSSSTQTPTPTPTPTPYLLHLAATSATPAATLSRRHRRGDPADPTHVLIPFAGRVVEVCVEAGDAVREGDVVVVVRQMKMELEVRSGRAGRAVWVFEGEEEEEEVGEGTLACVLELDGEEEGGVKGKGEKARL